MSLSRNPDPVPKNIHRPCVQPRDASVYLSLFTGFHCLDWLFCWHRMLSNLEEFLFACRGQHVTAKLLSRRSRDRLIATARPSSPTCSTLMSNSPWTFLPLNTFALQVKQRLESNYVSHQSPTRECKFLKISPSVTGDASAMTQCMIVLFSML